MPWWKSFMKMEFFSLRTDMLYKDFTIMRVSKKVNIIRLTRIFIAWALLLPRDANLSQFYYVRDFHSARFYFAIRLIKMKRFIFDLESIVVKTEKASVFETRIMKIFFTHFQYCLLSSCLFQSNFSSFSVFEPWILISCIQNNISLLFFFFSEVVCVFLLYFSSL